MSLKICKSTIKSAPVPTGLLIHLAKAAKTDDLSLPDDPKTLKQKHNPFAEPDPKHRNIPNTIINIIIKPRPTIPAPSMPNRNRKPRSKPNAKRKALAKKKQRHEALLKANEALNNLRMLQEHCQMVDISLEEQAKRYGMEDILAQFPQEVAAFKARE